MPKLLARATFQVPLGDGAVLTCDVTSSDVRAALTSMVARLGSAGSPQEQTSAFLASWAPLVSAGLVIGWQGFVDEAGRQLAFDRDALTALDAESIAAAALAAWERSEFGLRAAAQAEVNRADPPEAATSGLSALPPITTGDSPLSTTDEAA